jgi:hydroxylamine dehydrogenase
MGPDHSQMEIYNESKHGVMFAAQRNLLNLDADPQKLTTRDMFVPTCATCHMSGINGLKVTHNPSDRLSWYLAAEISTRRPNYRQAQINMKQVCTQCHTQPLVDRVYAQADQVVLSTNAKVSAAKKIVDGLRTSGALTEPPFSNPIDFTYFNLWHYDGRTSKHGAFMGGADFVQWHGNYELLAKTVELQHEADELRREHGRR